MATDKNYVMLAKLIQKVAGTEEGKTPEETIRIAVKELKRTQKMDFDLAKRLKKTGLMEGWSEYISHRFAGEPSVKNWAHLNFIEKGIFQPLEHGGDFKHDDDVYGDFDNVEEQEDDEFMQSDVSNDDISDFNSGEYKDTGTDITAGLAYSDIDNFLDTMSVDEYVNTVYDPEDFEEFDEFEDDFTDADIEDDEEDLQEALNRAQRMKIRNRMRRMKGIMARKRKLALKRHATMDVLKVRAKKLAIKMLKKRYAKKSVADMSFAERERVENILKKKKSLIDRLTTKMIPVVRKIERSRFEKKPSTPKEKK